MRTSFVVGMTLLAAAFVIMTDSAQARRGGVGVRSVGVHRAAVHRPIASHRPVHRPAATHRVAHRTVATNRTVNRRVTSTVSARRAHAATLPVRTVRPVRRVPRGVVAIRPYPTVRPWYWGRVVAGVTVGTIVAATVVGTAPYAPDPSLCWSWTDDSKAQGYWDYCSPPTE
jgi:hypothetical protein